MAKNEIEQVVEEDDDLLEASAETEEDEEQLDEFQADATGGDTFKGAAVAEPVTPSGGGGTARSADKSSAGDTTVPATPSKASVSKASLISQVMGKMNKMSKSTLQQLAGEVGSGQYGKNNLPASKPQSHGDKKVNKLDSEGKPPEQAPPKVSAQSAKEAVGEIFAGEELSEEFADKAATVFEATVNAKLIEASAHMAEEYEQRLEEQKEQFRDQLTDRVDEYLDYVAEEWMKENEVAIENALKIEIAESFIDGIKQVFEENYIEVPTEKVDFVDELTERTEELEEQLEDATKANIEIKSMRDDLERFKMFSQACDGLTMSQKDKLSQLSEGVEYESNEDYMSKIELLKEHYFSTKSAVTDAEDLNSDPVEVDQEAPKSGPMAAYSQAISRTVRQ
jgi:hypothetical protein